MGYGYKSLGQCYERVSELHKLVTLLGGLQQGIPNDGPEWAEYRDDAEYFLKVLREDLLEDK